MLKPLSLSALKPINATNLNQPKEPANVISQPVNTPAPITNPFNSANPVNSGLPVSTEDNTDNSQQQASTTQQQLSTVGDTTHEAEANKIDSVILTNISELEAKLIESNPDIKTNLIIIHRTLAKDPALVTILTTEQRRVIFQGYKKQAGIEIVAANSKKRTAPGSVKKNSDGSINLDEFM